ncbi:MAG: acyl--CoA ligase, partial [Oligoflexales bacterium]|nr:acyl--CoA ligase [Oligoflexales bacterium]
MTPAVPLLQDFLTDSASRFGEKIAVETEGGEKSYADIARESDSLASFLREMGLGRGDRVLVFADNTIETIVSFWAALKADGVISIINPLTKA